MICFEHFQKDQVFVARVFHVMSKGLGHEADIARDEIRRARFRAIEEDRHAALPLDDVVPVVGVLVSVQLPQAARLHGHVSSGDGGGDGEIS
jgi:hypothetical protein